MKPVHNEEAAAQKIRDRLATREASIERMKKERESERPIAGKKK